jgi:hypothetical protein
MNGAYAIASKLVHDGIRNGGTTIVRATGRPFDGDTGYVVGSSGNVTTFTIDASRHGEAMNLDYLVYPVVDWFLALPEDVPCVGSWFDGGTLYIDAVEIIADRSVALQAALRRNELAIYDLSANKEIRTPGNA